MTRYISWNLTNTPAARNDRNGLLPAQIPHRRRQDVGHERLGTGLDRTALCRGPPEQGWGTCQSWGSGGCRPGYCRAWRYRTYTCAWVGYRACYPCHGWGWERGNLPEICGYGRCKIKIKVNAKDNTRKIQKLCENIMQLLLLSGFINEWIKIN